MVQNAEWQFLRNDADEDEGLANAGVETFRGSPFPGLARECGQNSLDAAAIAADGSRHVRVHFRRIVVPTASVPSIALLQASIDACLDRARTRSIENETAFFEQAQRLLAARSLQVLQVSDTGTNGLRGPALPGHPFHALVKGTGVSQKPGSNAGGSFGIGKSAAYAISKLRTVFYSTTYGPSDVFLAQGKSMLTSHVDAEGISRRATGYCGTSTYGPIECANDVPEWLQLTDQGTTVSSLGFVAEADWQHEVTESLIRSFFAAIHRGTMTFVIDEVETIDAVTLGAIFERNEIRRAAEARGALEDLHFSAAMLRCLSSTDSDIFETEIVNLGKIRIRLLVEPGLPKRVGLLRNNMFITDSLSHFGDKLARFALQKDFVAVVEPADSDAGQIIRQLENPKHDELSAERLEDPTTKRRTVTAFKEMIRWIRASIQSRTMNATSSEVSLDEMNQFFASPRELERVQGDNTGEDHPETVQLSARKVIRRVATGSGKEGTLGGAGGRKPSISPGGQTSGGGAGKGTGGEGSRGGRRVPIKDPRNVILPRESGHVRRFTFTSSADATVRLQIVATGLASATEIAFRRADGGSNVFLVKQGERASVDVELFIPFAGPVEMALILVEGAAI